MYWPLDERGKHMNENVMIRMKEDYVLFQENAYVCVYRKSTKLVVLKLKAGDNAYSNAVRDDLERPHRIQWLMKQPYWRWLGVVLQKYPELFDEVSEDEAEKDAERTDYFSVVNRAHFIENYQVDHSFRKTKVYLWGATPLNKLLYENLKEMVPQLFLIRNEDDMADENSFLGPGGETQLEQDIPEDHMLSAAEKDQWKVSRDDLFLVDATGLDTELLLEINDYVVSRKTVALFYGNTPTEAVIGPLVIGEESACLQCMQNQDVLNQYYSGENCFLDRAFWHLSAFFIIRILYYIKDRNLYYLLSDAQIPINKVMTVSRENITAKMCYLHRDTGCKCVR